VIALCYCGRNLTDGILDARAVRVVGAVLTASRCARWVNELVERGLWVAHDDGTYEIKNYLDYNPSQASVKEERRKAKERMNKRRSGERTPERTSEWRPEPPSTPSRPDPKEQETSIATPVDKEREEQLSDYFRYADEIGFQGSPRLEALNLGPTLMDEALRRTRSRGDITNHAAYFTTVTRNLLAVQKAWKSEMPLDDRLLVYVQNAGHEYDDATLSIELMQKGADHGLIERLLVKADEIRNEEAA
jgi:hypothetical protein